MAPVVPLKIDTFPAPVGPFKTHIVPGCRLAAVGCGVWRERCSFAGDRQDAISTKLGDVGRFRPCHCPGVNASLAQAADVLNPCAL